MDNKLISVTSLAEGAKFLYKGHKYEVTSRDEYPFIEAECEVALDESGIRKCLFWNFEKVELLEGKILPPIQPVIMRSY